MKKNLDINFLFDGQCQEGFQIHYINNITHLLKINHATNTVTKLHLLEGCVDVGQRLTVGNELVNLQVARQVVVDKARQLGAALDTTESTSLPYTTSDQLECYISS